VNSTSAGDVEAFWDTAAAAYDRAFDAPGHAGHALRSRQDAVLSLLGDGPGKVLDAGMGPGRLLLALSERGWRVSGVDVSEQMVALARRRAPDAAERLVCASLERLPFSDSSFDAVVATGVLEYVGYAPGCVSELARVLRPEGLAVVGVPNRWLVWRRSFLYPLIRALKRISTFGRPAPLPRRRRSPGRRRFERALEAEGLAPESRRLTSFVIPFGALLPKTAARLADRLGRARSRAVSPLAEQVVYGARKRGEPTVPADYYRRINEVEGEHWWHRGMRAISGVLLEDRLRRGGRLLDVGCGTGGFLRWALEQGSFEQLSGADISPEAIELAGAKVPEADVRVAPIWDLPFEPGSFDLIVLNDVLQHVPEAHLRRALREVRRMLRDDGELLIRTNGSRRAHSEGDWRVYDRASLRSTLELGGFRCRRLTYANLAGSLWAAARGAGPRAPSAQRHGIPSLGSARGNSLMYPSLRIEASYLRHSPLGIPYGHTLFALATPEAGASASAG
jgi:ubiquinone/menaquinone biosynthesis C-methylase UbiE